MTANNQAMEDLKEQMELKRLYASCDQVIFYSEVLYQKYHAGIGKYWGFYLSVCMRWGIELCLAFHFRIWSLRLSW